VSEAFYEKSLLLQFKFFLCLFLLMFSLTFCWIFYETNFPLYFAFLYVCYVGTIYAINLFFELRDLRENINLYIPKDPPKPFREYDIHLDSDVLTDGELRLLYEWAFQNKSMREKHLHPMVLNRLLRKYVRNSLKRKEEKWVSG